MNLPFSDDTIVGVDFEPFVVLDIPGVDTRSEIDV